MKHTFDADNYRWDSAYDVYWTDDHTHIDVYGYYPYGNPGSIESYAFTVERDQNRVAEGGRMGGYEASDFLWGKVADVAPTSTVIRLPMNHRMADGTVTAAGDVEPTATIPAQVGDEWRAIVVPQTVKGGTTLFSITIGGVPYKFSKEEDFLPDNLETVPTATFQNCTRLTVVHLGSGTTLVSDYAFDGCPLTDLYVDAAYPPVCNANTFTSSVEDLLTTCTLHVPTGRKNLYKADTKWGKFKYIVDN